MNAGLRVVLFILAAGSTTGAGIVLFELPAVAALLIGALVGTLAALAGPPVLRFAVDLWDA